MKLRKAILGIPVIDWLFVLLVFFLAAVTLSIGINSGQVLAGISAGASIALTGALVILYRQQSEILYRQKELTEANHRALPRVLTYNLLSWQNLYWYNQEEAPSPEYLNYPNQTAVFLTYISNPAKGYAENINVELKIETENYTSFVVTPLTAATNEDQLIFQEGEGGVLASDTDPPTLYTAFLSFDDSNLPDDLVDTSISTDSTISPTELLWVLGDAGEPTAKIGVFIHYRDGTGVRAPLQLLTSRCELGGYEDITTRWRRGEPIPGEIEPAYSLESDLEN